MWIFPHQQAEKSLQNQHVLSILQVGSHQLQYRFFRTKKPKSHHKTNTFCPITPKKCNGVPEHQRHHKQHSNTTTRRRNSTPRHTKNRHPIQMSACGGARGIRTPDLLIANETRYQLRHSPKDSNSLAPSQSAVQADHRRVRHDTVMEPNREPCRQRDSNECAIANTPRRKTPPALHTRASEPTVPTAPTCDRAASQVARGAATTARSSPIGPCAHPGRRPGRGRRSDRRRPLRSSGHRPGQSGRWGERGSPP